MLDIDKSTVDFLVTENMVQEVEKVLSHDVSAGAHHRGRDGEARH